MVNSKYRFLQVLITLKRDDYDSRVLHLLDPKVPCMRESKGVVPKSPEDLVDLCGLIRIVF